MTRSDFQPYLASTGGQGEALVACLREVPALYYKDFAPEDGATFRSACPFTNVPENLVLQEKLSHYLDVVELHLVKEISLHCAGALDVTDDLQHLLYGDELTGLHCFHHLRDRASGGAAEVMLLGHDEVMLLGHDDKYLPDSGMQVTIAFNHFSMALVQRMPRCRHGYIHVVNNDFTRWEMYAIGGSGNPTINSQGNRYTAPQDQNAKEVTKCVDTNEGDWSDWNWRTERNGTVRTSATTSRSSPSR
ncbi:hypothetical protein C1H46_038512 [Malus baccata]|uniref:Pectate lyase domain-containing protein n=1 Tax=Malus baccata TaxID=106549 RepID=A0A540KP61_MALBA|nr:hypothetical protein C1H46_038512 [Malus baccata]